MNITEIIERWFREKIATGAIARDTAAYNQAFAAKADLIERLSPAPPAQPAAPTPSPEPAAEAAQKE